MFKVDTIKFKISVLYVLILGLILIVYTFLLYFNLRFAIYRDLDRELENKAKEVASIVQSYMDIFGKDAASVAKAAEKAILLEKRGPDQEAINAIEARYLQNVDIHDMRSDYINLLDHRGEPLLKLAEEIHPRSLWNYFKSNLRPLSHDGAVLKDIRLGKHHLRVLTMAYDFKAEDKYFIRIGTPLRPTIHSLNGRWTAVLISFPLVLIAASFIGRIFAMRILKPVVEVTKTAEKITHEDLSARVRTEHADEEVRYLIKAFNGMIERLETAFKYISDFSAHVAHELKTPLAIIRGEAQVALRNPRSPEEYERVIKVGLEESQRMIRVIEDMLLLSKLEYESEVFKFEPLNFKDFMRDIHEYGKILAGPKNIQVTLKNSRENIILSADEVHLRRLFLNLMDNAVKFSPAGGSIELSVRIENKWVHILIADQGPGIPAAVLPRIFDKFFHQSPQDSNVSGTGLGLSVAKSIAKAHRGDIQVKSVSGQGSVFTVILPLA